MYQRKQAGAGNRKQRHRFGKAIDRLTPLLPKQQENRRNQRPCMADADPPDEIDDIESPGYGDHDAEQANADGDHRSNAKEKN
jgi:hypothetical protein